VSASIVQVAPLPLTVISPLSQSVTPAPPVLAIVTIPSAPVPVVVRVIFAPSTIFKLPPVADRVAVCEVASLVLAIV